MRKGLMISSMLLGAALVLSGCGNNGDNNVQPNANGADGVGTNNYRRQNTDGNGKNGNNNNSRMEMSDRIADQLVKLPGVDAAYVMMTDRNAYVAIVQSRNGANGSGNQGRSSAKSGNGKSRSNSANSGNGTGGSDVAADLKDRIANRVKSMSPSIENVYVTANPDFVTRMKSYAQDIANGHPLRGS
ncbi:hypothetical protein SD71_18105 [Cohnella kolymensis]|uniref:Sporulation protein n=1 Tax=Cohnella kolymensis TaxID=1590652 RepID=A0ABR5A0U3_9BACL|nr:YhcN/YlaJ family sporulation lipoprotein [Cohnella kolymensis]KIL34679.1 hypothetical protein SD71_18105 [Cohnella kolymensis]